MKHVRNTSRALLEFASALLEAPEDLIQADIVHLFGNPGGKLGETPERAFLLFDLLEDQNLPAGSSRQFGAHFPFGRKQERARNAADQGADNAYEHGECLPDRRIRGERAQEHAGSIERRKAGRGTDGDRRPQLRTIDNIAPDLGQLGFRYRFFREFSPGQIAPLPPMTCPLCSRKQRRSQPPVGGGFDNDERSGNRNRPAGTGHFPAGKLSLS